MVKILHTADIHLDSPLKSLAMRNESLRETVEAATRTALEKIIDTAIDEEAIALLIAGDLFDGKQRSARTAVFLTRQLDRLRSSNIRVFYIKGNHDAENTLSGAIDLPGNVHVFSGRGEKVQLTDNIWIHGVSFTQTHAPDSLLPKFPSPVAGAVNIALLHTSLAGAAGHDVYAPCSVNDLKDSGFDYWALGHVHKRQIHSESPWVVMPGMPQGRDIGEAGTKSATLLQIDDGKIDITEIPTSAAEFLSETLDVTNIDNDDSLKRLMRDTLLQTANKMSATAGVVRLTLHGAPVNHWQILRDIDYWREQAAELARETERLWLDKLIFKIEAPDKHNSASATDELAVIIEQIRNEESFTHIAVKQVEELLGELPREVRATMLSDESRLQTLTTELGKAGAQQVLARMKAADNQ